MKNAQKPAASESASPRKSSLIDAAVVEDDASVRGILASWIRQADGMTCVGEYCDAETAIEVLPGVAPTVALVDINLPGANGIVCVRRLKPLLPLTQFVMLTVYEDADHIFDALAAGATGYLVKRTPREAVIAALREVSAGGSPMSTNIARKVVQFLQQPASAAETNEGLSYRENEVLALLARGYMYKEISDSIGISLATVSTYIRRIYEKLHVRSRAQAVARYTRYPSDRAPRK
jgi:DNA-binding NarL/FixJ family response regulator